MKKNLLISLFAIMMLVGCAAKKDISQINIPQDKIYNVIFEGQPDISDKRLMSSSEQIGDVLQQTPSGSDLTVVKVSVKEAYTQTIHSNTVFVVSDGHLNYETVGDVGETLPEGGRLLGFTSKAKLIWFKTKAKVTGMSQATKEKAEQLYKNATTK
ncbi:MAG: hypothetical protein HOP02_05190 [Methylococcaceae bacterium]|nr:hypothetical protein [Methylococcaceae bacterium]